MLVDNISHEMKRYIEVVKNTDFFSKFIKCLYVCDETPEVLWASFKAPYTKIDEVSFWQETTKFSDFVLGDADFAMKETDGGTQPYLLKEVKSTQL